MKGSVNVNVRHLGWLGLMGLLGLLGFTNPLLFAFAFFFLFFGFFFSKPEVTQGS